MNPPEDPSQPVGGEPRHRIVLVDDHPVVIAGYRLMLNAQPGLEVCATATNGADALLAVEREHPDLVVTDLTMPGRSGIDLIKDLLARHPGLKVMVCSMHDEMLHGERALRAGARGYVNKDSPGPVMLAAIHQVLSGGIYVSERLATRLHVTDAPDSSQPALEKLSDEEFEVFRLFGEGRTAKEIASLLHLQAKDVADHRDRIKEKLEFATSAEMIRQAGRWGAEQKTGS